MLNKVCTNLRARSYRFCSTYSRSVKSLPNSIRSSKIRSRPNFHQLCRYCHSQTELKNDKSPHVPVMADEVLGYLEPKPGQTFIDMTFGAGGHTKRILNSAPDVKIYALDRDPIAHEYAIELASQYPGQIVPLLGRFSELPKLLNEHNVRQNQIDGILFDFGCSSMQFDVSDRGFSVSKDGPLDMRMDGFRCPEQPTAADVLARMDENDLARVIKVYGDEKKAKKIARAIVETRYSFKKLETTFELAELVNSVLTKDQREDQLGRFAHNATKTFQALRIFVNNELNEINYGIVIAERYLKVGGRMITIAFHSLEDMIVKRHISGNVSENLANKTSLRYANHNVWFEKSEIDDLMRSPWEMLHNHVLVPSEEEVRSNPRSRSARFRASICTK